ncbi:MAG: decaprenyl-phosphate phosphoribosyltransferase [Spirochaetia bacterium]
MKKIQDIVSLIRIKHWIKNAFVLAPFLFTLRVEQIILVHLSTTFFAFCFASSFVYILNDILDKHQDRLHPKKKDRPIASGRVPVTQAAALLLGLGLLTVLLLSFSTLQTGVVICLYITMNIIYSKWLKSFPILDVIIIALGFVLRVTAGTFAIGVQLSNWMLLTTFCLSLFLGFGKRRNELAHVQENNTRKVLQEYSLETLNIFIIISSALTIICYAMYSIDIEVISRTGTSSIIFTVPFVIYGIFRYILLLFTDPDIEDPTDAVTTDISIIVTCILWALSIIGLLVFTG